ncbi:MAG: SDR family NAD(P)-dependent oxidoreductase [Zavarzinella sp.]
MAQTRVMITGASSGIGHALAREYAQAGAHVGLVARREAPLQELSAQIEASGGKAAYATADIQDYQQVQQAVQQLLTHLGGCDIMIANAGVGGHHSATSLNIHVTDKVIRTNLLGPLYTFEAILPTMLQQKSGQLVAISSMAAWRALPNVGAYCASKAGLNTFMRSLRMNLHGTGIATTVINPGFVATPMTEKNPTRLWVQTPEKAARRIRRAISRKKTSYSFPKRMTMLMNLVRFLPDSILRKMIPPEKEDENQ